MAIDVTFTSPPTAPTSSDAANFRSRADAFVAWIASFVSLLITFVTQVNSTQTSINAKEESTQTAKVAAQLAQANAETAMTTAYATANFLGAWNSITDFGNASCEHLGFVYVSKINPNVNHVPTDTASWTMLTKDVTIDEKVSHLSETAKTFDSSNNLTSITYVGGYKCIYTFTNNILTLEQYTDTDGVTVLLTLSYSYDANGNLLPVVRS